MIQPKFDQYAAQYDYITPIQDEVVHYLWQKIMACQNGQKQDFSQNQPMTWLDVGCGTGKLSQELLNNCTNSNFQLIALDKSPAMLVQFSQRQEFVHFSPSIKLVTADMTAMTLASDSVDRLMSSFALHWVNPTVLAELSRITKTGGQIHLAIPVAGSLSAVNQRFPLVPIFPFLTADDWLEKIDNVIKLRGGQWLYNEQHTFYYTYPNLATLLKSLKQMGGAVSGQSPMSPNRLKQYLADTQPIALDYRVLVVGFQV